MWYPGTRAGSMKGGDTMRDSWEREGLVEIFSIKRRRKGIRGRGASAIHQHVAAALKFYLDLCERVSH